MIDFNNKTSAPKIKNVSALHTVQHKPRTKKKKLTKENKKFLKYIKLIK